MKKIKDATPVTVLPRGNTVTFWFTESSSLDETLLRVECVSEDAARRLASAFNDALGLAGADAAQLSTRILTENVEVHESMERHPAGGQRRFIRHY
jgi:hypothetical protein